MTYAFIHPFYPQFALLEFVRMNQSVVPADSNDAGQALWQSCIDLLAQELPEQQFNTWIKPLQASVSEDFSK